MNLFIYSQIAFIIIFINIKNILLLFKLNSKIKKHTKYKQYEKSIRLKLCFTFTQFIIFIIYTYYYFILNEYLLFKNELCTELERNILLESIEILLLIIISIIYLPIIKVYGFNHFISIRKLKNLSQKKYLPNLIGPSSFKKNKFIKFAKKNYKKRIIILNPRVFLDKNKKNKKFKSLDKNIQIGKLMCYLN